MEPEPEPTPVQAEPVHEPGDVRDLMRQKLFTNLASVGGLADLGDLAHKVQPDMVPADVTVTEDTVAALLRAIVALTLVPPPLEATLPPEVPSLSTPSPPVQPAKDCRATASATRPSKSRMKRTPTWGEGVDAAMNEAIHFMENSERVSAAQSATLAYRTAAIDGRHSELSAELNAEGMIVESTAQALRARDPRTSRGMGVDDDATERAAVALDSEADGLAAALEDAADEHTSAVRPPGLGDDVCMSAEAQHVVTEHLQAARGLTAPQ